jgi:hypothetical protein
MSTIVDNESYVGYSIWMSTLVELPSRVLPLSVGPAALLSIGAIPYGLTTLFFLSADGPRSISIVTAQTLAATIAAVGPLFIWHYDERVFRNFVTEVRDIVTDEDDLIDTINNYERFFATRYWLLAVPWTVLIISALIANIGFFETIGVSGVLDPAFVIYLVFATWWSIITGIGLHGALTTILCVRSVSDLEIDIDPLHPDNLGGLSTIGYFSIRATLLNSIGSFALPLAFAIAARGGYQSLVYAAVAGYIGFIAASFLYPTLYVNRRAQDVRDSVLETKREQIQALRTQSTVDTAGGDLSELETQLKIQTLRDEFQEYQSVNLYPLTISILTRLVSSILLPIAFTLLETYVFSA